MKLFLLLPLCLFLAACDYHFEGEGIAATERSTLTVPYIPGDAEGKLTDELMRELGSSGRFNCVQEGGQLTLCVRILSNANEKIGYQYDTKDPSGKRLKNLIATEGRKNLSAEVTVLQASTGEALFGPEIVKASSEFDYVNPSSMQDMTFVDPAGIRQTVIQFSLGQLDTIEGAQDDVLTPLYRELAKKVVDAILIEVQ